MMASRIPLWLGRPVGIDRINAGSDANTENIEDKPAADRRPPPPPDHPGEEGLPSRADSRRGAAAANSRPETAPSEQETAGEQNDVPSKTGPERRGVRALAAMFSSVRGRRSRSYVSSSAPSRWTASCRRTTTADLRY
ncbi:hypothetical protein [Actinoallomurus sp. CA-150999]|uniref:hypothetical protein n=1 Tax=Actinoallomurus sp. CA-150999 TaxID=3239887 RepID=UPI003D8F3105